MSGFDRRRNHPSEHTMNLTLFFDTETSGMKLDGVRASDPRQPHIVSFSALVLDENWNEITSQSAIIRQDGWESEPGATEIHGITKERSLVDGIPEIEAAEILHGMIAQASRVVAHSIQFDSFIVRVALRRYGILTGDSETEGVSIPWAIKGKEFCTMWATTQLCKLPGKYAGRYKWPKLKEACEILLKETVQEGNHDAIEDVRACARLYRWLCENGHGPKAKEVVA